MPANADVVDNSLLFFTINESLQEGGRLTQIQPALVNSVHHCNYVQLLQPFAQIGPTTTPTYASCP